MSRSASARCPPTAVPAAGRPASAWRLAAQALARPYRVTAPMVALVMLVPFYIFLPELLVARAPHRPALALDDALPLRPAWALVYGALYLFLIVLPVLLVREQDHVDRTVQAYLLVWITAYACFLLYPTTAPRPAEVAGSGFGIWGLRALYAADTPRNCFPSLHVAHSFVSALTCLRVHRDVATAALAGAGLVGLSTLYTKQHYVSDVAAGLLLALVAWALFLRRAGETAGEPDRRVAPLLAAGLAAAIALGVGGAWVLYLVTAG